MESANTLLFSDDPTLIESCQQVVHAVPRLRFSVAPCPDLALASLPRPDVALFLAHMRHKGDTEYARCLLRGLDASGNPRPTVILTEQHLPNQALELMRHGAIDYLSRPLDLNRLSYLIEMATLRARYAPTRPAVASPPDLFDGMESPSMTRLIEQIRRVAPQETTVLLGGETGTGKTRLARLIHENSPRADQPFHVVNCGSLAPNLIESEMFGHVRGAFTGADRERTGKFAEVGRGTLLLDEVDALPPALQAKLLRVIGEKVFEPVGSNKSLPVQARLITASNRDLSEEVREGRFRADLYYRLNVIGFYLPPLRERKNLIPSLCNRFLEEFTSQVDGRVRSIDPVALQALVAHGWPGNIRELRNVMERAVVLCHGSVIQLEDLPDELVEANYPAVMAPVAPTHDYPSTSSLQDARGQAEMVQIMEALRRNNNNRARAAVDLGISRMTLYNKLRKLNLI